MGLTKEHRRPLPVLSSRFPNKAEGTAALADEWLTSIVRQSLQSSFGSLEPPHVIWNRVQQHILQSSLQHGKGAGVKPDRQDPGGV
jgi:hypothetical protein